MKNLKKIALMLLVIACVLSATGYVYNYPIHFWPVDPKSAQARYEAGSRPDNIVLTPADDMQSSISVTWRTASSVTDGVVQFARLSKDVPLPYEELQAERKTLYSRELSSNSTVSCYSATFTGLAPGASYRYRVGSRSSNNWSDYHTFTTATAKADSFSFVYFGDTQVYPDRFAKMLADVEERHPESAFYMISGDIVENGAKRNLWDEFLAHTGGVFSSKALVPAAGNHDLTTRNGGRATFSSYFSLPGQGRSTSGSELNYGFQCGNTYFVVINARRKNLEEQTGWLEAELQKAAASNCSFKIVMCHFPVYNTRKDRRSPLLHQHFVPLFDKYGVDMVLSGHDHNYMRSLPLKAGQAVSTGQSGTTYVISTACEQFYEAEKLDIAEKQISGALTYQLINISSYPDGDPVLRYQARNPSGEVLDEFELRK